MSKNYNSTLQSNNTDLEEILNTINALPEAGQNNGAGIVVSSIVNTESTADGGMNTLEFDLTDGTHVELNAKNGNTGSPGAKGDPYTLTNTDKASIAASVKNSFTTETWTFTLSDGSVITKQIVLST